MDQEKIWSHFQGARVDAFYAAEPRYAGLVREVVRRCPTIRGCALNVGIGSGGVERRLIEHGWTVKSLDPDHQAVDRLRREGLQAHQGYAEAMPFPDGFFDAIVMSEVLEHIPPKTRTAVLSEAARTLKPGGFLIGTVPYREVLQDSETVCPECGAVFHRWGHVSSFDKASLSDELSAQFNVLMCKPWAFVDWSHRRSLMGLLKGLTRWLLAMLGEGMASPNLFFVASKRFPNSTSNPHA